MKPKSETTFNEEYDILINQIPEGFWGGYDESKNLEHFGNEIIKEFYQERHSSQESLVMLDIPPRHEYDVSTIDLAEFYDTINNSDLTEDEFLDYIENQLNVDFDGAIGHPDSEADIYGSEAYGCYLPFHSFYESKTTPWGIYMFPQEITKAVKLFLKLYPSEFSKQSAYRFYFNAVLRHEIFHFHVEKFATRAELITNKPIYKPYNENVNRVTQYSEDWLEEALAEATVLKSRFVMNSTNLPNHRLRKIYQTDLQRFPAGYRHYHCEKYGGAEKAMKYFAAQIITGKVNPDRATTDLLLPNEEYRNNDFGRVPGYIIVKKKKERFQ